MSTRSSLPCSWARWLPWHILTPHTSSGSFTVMRVSRCWRHPPFVIRTQQFDSNLLSSDETHIHVRSFHFDKTTYDVFETVSFKRRFLTKKQHLPTYELFDSILNHCSSLISLLKLTRILFVFLLLSPTRDDFTGEINWKEIVSLRDQSKCEGEMQTSLEYWKTRQTS